jgi:hypothetical protein
MAETFCSVTDLADLRKINLGWNFSPSGAVLSADRCERVWEFV